MSKAKVSIEAGSSVRPISVSPGVKLTQSSGGAIVSLLCLRRLRLNVGRVQRVGEERVLDVGGDQFLVLLLVLETERDAARGFIFQRMLQQAIMAASTWAR